VFFPCWARNSLLGPDSLRCASADGQAGPAGNRAQQGIPGAARGCCLLGPARNSGPSRGKTRILLNRSLSCQTAGSGHAKIAALLNLRTADWLVMRALRHRRRNDGKHPPVLVVRNI
jgi:hypothetical protein